MEKLKSNILLVDDNPSNLQALRAILEELNQNLFEANSGEEALQRLEQTDSFAVILLDINMPGVSGFDTARLIRTRTRTQHTPIIFLTAHDLDRTQLEEGYRLGAVDLLVKPLVPVILQAKVREFVELHHEKELARREAEQLRLLVDGAKDYAIFLLDATGHIASWNPGAERIKRYQASEIIGKHFSCFYTEEAKARGWPEYELQVAGVEGRFEDEGWRLRKDGTQFWANVVITALRDSAGKLQGFSKITRDMTDRKRAEESLHRLIEEEAARRAAEENARAIQEQREKLQVTLASIGDAVISTDAEGRVTFLNPIAVRLVGWNPDEARGQSLPDVFRIINEETRQKVENPAFRAIRDGRIVGLANHTVLISRTGEERPIDDSAAPIRDLDGKVIGSVLVFRDITERRRAQDELLKSEERLRLALEAGKMGVWDWNIRTNQLKWSENLEPLHGLAPGSFGGTFTSFQELVHPDDRPLVRNAIENAIADASGYEIEFRNVWPNGSIHWIAGKGKVFFGSDGQPERMIGIGMDVTQRKRGEQTARFLADASAALTGLVDFDSTLQKLASLAVPYFADWVAVDILEENGTLRRVAVAHVDANKIALAKELHQRFPPDPESRQGVWNILRTGDPEMVSDISDEFLKKSVEDRELLKTLRELGLKSYIGMPLKVRGQTLGAITFITAESAHRYDDTDLTVAQDLADRVAIAIENSRLYSDLRDADRRKDEFLATLAHELRNPLAPIRNSLQILKMPRVDAATANRITDMMERQVQHLVRLVDDLLDVSRVMKGKVELRKEPTELAAVIARAVETVQPLIEASGHQFTITTSPDSLIVEADPVRLAQVIGNLLTNAVKYTEEKGHIWLTAKRDGDSAVLIVGDTGIGIAPDVLPHIFELFVQADHSATRSQGGLGIGLTLVKNLVDLHNGTVTASSAGLGKGSEFKVRLPLSTVKVNEPTRLGYSRSVRAPISGHRLLVVDDNKDAADTLAMMLRLQGHDVAVAHSGTDALDIVTNYQPKLVFLDIGMPGMDGYEVARRLRQRPETRDLVLAAVSGWGQEDDRRRSAEAGFDHHLLKPPDPKALQNLLANLK